MSADFAIEFAARSISGIYGLLDDLPEELADTIANQYVKVAVMMTDWTQARIPPDVPMEAFLEKLTKLQANIEHLPELIKQLREMRQAGRDDLFDYWSQFTLDDMKYGIQNADAKSAIQRSIERRSKKVAEISGLYGILRASPWWDSNQMPTGGNV